MIYAHTPIEPTHEICVGNFQQQQDIPKGTVCMLVGVNTGGANDFVVEQNLLVNNKPFVKTELRHCVVELPLPRDIRSVRLVPVPETDPAPFSGNDGQNLHPKIVTMVQVFIYDFADLSAVTVKPLTPSLTMNSDGQTANLHFFAEHPGGFHAMKRDADTAYQHMAQMFGLDITPAVALFTGPVDPQIIGLTKDDTRLLDEPAQMGGEHAEESGSNCDGLVIDNRSSRTSKTRRK